MARQKYRVGSKVFRFCCDASEYSFQLCLPYRQHHDEYVRIRQYDDHSYGVWHKDKQLWIAIFKVEGVS